MKFFAPEVEIKKFNVNDILTTSGNDQGSDSGDVDEATAAAGTGHEAAGMPCTGNASDNFVPDCAF